MSIVAGHRESCTFQHDAFIYDSDDGYLKTLIPLIEEAMGAGDSVIAVVPRHNGALLRAGLDAPTDSLEFIDAETWYHHPISTIGAYDDVLRRLPPRVRAFVIGEVQFRDSEADWTAWTRYEAALNRALRDHNARVICPYDERVLPPSVVENARRTHPYLLTATDSHCSTDFVDVETLFGLLPPTVTVPTWPPAVDLTVGAQLRVARHAFAAAATAAGCAADRVEDLTLAVNEVLTNAILHGGGAARLRVWSTETELTCVVDDPGTGVDDPLLGYTAPPPGSSGGYGVWLARRIFERSELVSSPTHGLTFVLATRL